MAILLDPDQLSQEAKAAGMRLLSVEKLPTHKLWSITIGPTHLGEIRSGELDFGTQQPILMNPGDILRFAYELRSAIKCKPLEKEELDLSFTSTPRMRVHICFKDPHPQVPFNNPHEIRAGEHFEFSPTVNVHFLAKNQIMASGDEYLYEGEGHNIGPFFYFKSDMLAQFADDLESEVRATVGEEEYLRIKKDLEGHAKKKKKQTQ